VERTDWDWRCLKLFTGLFGEILLGGEFGAEVLVVVAVLLGEGSAVGEGNGEVRAVASWAGGDDVGVGAEFG